MTESELKKLVLRLLNARTRKEWHEAMAALKKAMGQK